MKKDEKPIEIPEEELKRYVDYFKDIVQLSLKLNKQKRLSNIEWHRLENGTKNMTSWIVNNKNKWESK